MLGTSLSHYRITEKLGQGGMGEVYRAEDTNLSRQVAIKVLPDEFAHNAERLARFEREAKLLASLNHPNIAAIHGLEEHEGKRFLVLELVGGQTLAERLGKGRIPLDETLDICRQIAEGLEAAHEKGIIHRDLKPSNVKVTPEGKVKVLDFGLAKAFQGEPAAPDVSKSPTLTSQMTRAGVILGTAAYMSPEQTKGKAVDKRADIWAFGCVLFECLTGKRAFQGETITETVASILKSEPDWSLLPADIPPVLRSLLMRCLRKDPNVRLREIGDATLELKEAEAQPTATQPMATAITGMKWTLAIPLLLSVLALGAVLGGFLIRKTKPWPTPEVMRLNVGVEPATQLGGGWRGETFVGGRPTRTAFALTPDGRKLVYYGLGQNGKTQLYVRRFDQQDASAIPGTEWAFFPTLSPDGKWVGFFSSGGMKRVPIEGGTPSTICDVPAPPYGASWGERDVIVYSCQDRLWKVRASGGTPEAITTPDLNQGDYTHSVPHFLPGGDTVLFSNINSPNINWDNPAVEALTLATGKRKLLLDEGADAQYLPTGHLLFARRGKLYAAGFDLERLEVVGEPTVVIEDIMQAMNSQGAYTDNFAVQFSFSNSGTAAYVPGGIYPDQRITLSWLDRKGVSQPATATLGTYWAMRLSPDGNRVAYYTAARQQNVWVLDLDRGTRTQLTFGGIDSNPVWTPDGKYLAYESSMKKGADRILEIPAAAGGQPKELLKCERPDLCIPAEWSPDGQYLAYAKGDDRRGYDIFILHRTGGKSEEFLKTQFYETQPDFSPDGRWIAYASNETGRQEIYVQPFPRTGVKHMISTEGGSCPVWNREGTELYYVQFPDNVMVAEITAKPQFRGGKPRVLIDLSGLTISLREAFGGFATRDFDTDGRRFLIAEFKDRTDVPPVTQIRIVQNWLEELKRLVPVK